MKIKDKSKDEVFDKEFDSKENFNSEETQSNYKSERNRFREFGASVIHALGGIIKFPFKMFARYLRDELILAIKKDAKIYTLILGLMGVLFVFFSVMWFFVSVAIGVYFYDNGCSILSAVMYSIGFQTLSFILIALIVLFASKRLNTLKLFKKLGNAIE